MAKYGPNIPEMWPIYKLDLSQRCQSKLNVALPRGPHLGQTCLPTREAWGQKIHSIPYFISPPPLSLSLFFSSGSAADSHWEGWLHRKGSSRDGRCRLGVLPWGEVRPGLQIPTRSRATHHCRGTGWHLPGLRQQLPRFAYLNLYKTQPVFGSMQFSQCQMVKKVVLYLVIK